MKINVGMDLLYLTIIEHGEPTQVVASGSVDVDGMLVKRLQLFDILKPLLAVNILLIRRNGFEEIRPPVGTLLCPSMEDYREEGNKKQYPPFHWH